jgi:cytochrome oxidase assembly protein ShyY1
MGNRCKFYHGTWQELRDYKNTEYIEHAHKKQAAPPKPNANKSKNQKYAESGDGDLSIFC